MLSLRQIPRVEMYRPQIHKRARRVRVQFNRFLVRRDDFFGGCSLGFQIQAFLEPVLGFQALIASSAWVFFRAELKQPV